MPKFTNSIVAFILIFGLNPCFCFAQKRPKIYFLADSIEIGRPFRVGFSFRHSNDIEVFFPDTATAFVPFKVLAQENFATQAVAEGSLDSAVYTLVPFDLSFRQSLLLPVWVKIDNDCTAVYSEKKSIALKSTRTTSNQLLSDTAVEPLPQKTNYPFWLFGLLAILLLGGSIFVFFRKSVKKYWLLFKSFRDNREFRSNLKRLKKKFEEEKQQKYLEAILVLWKRYLQRLLQIPFMTFTTKEIMDNISDNNLAEALRTLDEAIYGGVVSNKTNESITVLQNIAQQRYLELKQEILTKTNKNNSNSF